MQARSFSLGGLHNYGQGPKWVKGIIIDNTGPYNFSVEVTVSDHDQLTRWKRHANKSQKCYYSSSVIKNFVDLISDAVSFQQVATGGVRERGAVRVNY